MKFGLPIESCLMKMDSQNYVQIWSNPIFLEVPWNVMQLHLHDFPKNKPTPKENTK